ncbi:MULTISPECIES: hypothetical protein [Gracilibacillus]|uniref:Uncharacterized protein n=1 Tax=Gracilibacillus dipsosauri TaxID=178340 RepID=A0A317L4D5_9BACI|nr:hypothetical protein [Gracilibacillus dipsosauri]PWU69840.1 hypothetical protein DLJ74_02605 [Gracilibacillus dipsosauri]
MELSTIWRYGKTGLKTFLLSLQFFYSHLSLLSLSLIPALFRTYQMWNDQTPIWLEIIVELTRVVLILLMIRLMSKSSFRRLRQRSFWDNLVEICTIQVKRNWPYRFIAQIIVFVVLLFGLGNFLISLIVNQTLDPLMGMIGLQAYEYSHAHDAYLFFLKNMSVIPLAMVYILKMCGVKPIRSGPAI